MNEFNYDDSAYLAHHGVKGMKWGVRKDRSAYRTSGNLKRFIKKNGKKIAIGAGIATASAAALGAGLGIAASRNYQPNRQKRYDKQAHNSYNNTNAIIERIKSNPNSYNAGNKYAKTPSRGTYDTGRVNAITGAIAKSNPRSNYKATARAKATQTNRVIDRINNNPNAYSSNSSRANFIQQQSVIDRINNNPNAYDAGNKYAKKRKN